MNKENSNEKKQEELKECKAEAKEANEQLDSVEAQLEKTKEEYAGLWDRYVRLNAEFDNARKRWDKDRQDLFKFGNFSLLSSLLVIVDELEHALRMVCDHKDVGQIAKGIEMTFKNFTGILAKHNVTAIEAKGKKFDPFLHEIAGSLPSDGEEHVVLEEIQKGYMIEDKVLRAAKVIVSVKPAEEVKKEAK